MAQLDVAREQQRARRQVGRACAWAGREASPGVRAGGERLRSERSAAARSQESARTGSQQPQSTAHTAGRVAASRRSSARARTPLLVQRVELRVRAHRRLVCDQVPKLAEQVGADADQVARRVHVVGQRLEDRLGRVPARAERERERARASGGARAHFEKSVSLGCAVCAASIVRAAPPTRRHVQRVRPRRASHCHAAAVAVRVAF